MRDASERAAQPPCTQQPDLASRDEIHNLVVAFYREVAFDDLLGPVFIDVAHVNWSVHIPKLIDYWCRVLLGQPGYDGSFLAPHAQLNAVSALRPELFDRWYELFAAEVDAGWHGPNAERAKSHAARMAENLARRLLDVDLVVCRGRPRPTRQRMTPSSRVSFAR